MKPANLDALIDTVAANHGLPPHHAAVLPKARRKPLIDHDDDDKEENLVQAEETVQGDAQQLAYNDAGLTMSDELDAITIDAVTTDDLVSDAEATGFTITGTGKPGATVTLSFDSNTTLVGGNTAVVDASGHWSITVGSADMAAFSKGCEFITATQTDVASNVLTATRAFNVGLADLACLAGVTGAVGAAGGIGLGTVALGVLAVGGIAAAAGGGGGNSAPVANAAANALATISAYAENNGGIAPVAADYTAAGVTGFGSAGQPTVAQINEALATSSVVGTDADSAAEVQGIVNAWQTILTNADGTADNAPAPTAADYDKLGITGVASGSPVETLLGDVIDAKTNPEVDTVAEVQALADIVGKLMQHAAGTPQTISQTELETLGLTNLTPGRTADLLNKVAASADDGTGIDTLTELQAMVDITAPTQTVSNVDISADTGTSATDFITNTASQTITGTLSGALATGDILYGSVDNGANWTDITAKVSGGTAISWDGATLSAGSNTILFKVTDAAGNDSATTGSQAYVLDTTVPTAPGINAVATDDVVNATEATDGITITGTGEAGATVTLSFDSGTTLAGGNTAVVDGSGNWSIAVDSADVTAFGQGNETITATQTDTAGNTSTTTSRAITVDTTAPVFSSGTDFTWAENTPISTTVYDAIGDGDSGVSYTLGGADAGLFSITGTGAVTFLNSPDFEAPADSNGDNVYDITVIATDTAGNSTSQSVTIRVTDVFNESIAGQPEIDLGADGKLIAPVQVEGHWYYYWDRSGDGTNANTGSLNGGVDYVDHTVLDGIFTQDINGNSNPNPGSGTTDTYRYATLNGVKVALPTANGGMLYPNGEGNFQSGTTVDDGATTNPTYDDLLAIWDAHNGAGTGNSGDGGGWIDGTPPGWTPFGYWSATPSANGHTLIGLWNGLVQDNGTTNYVALEVV